MLSHKKCQVPGSMCQLLTSIVLCLVSYIAFVEHTVFEKALKPGTRNLEPGTQNPEPGTRNPKPGTWNPEPGT